MKKVIRYILAALMALLVSGYFFFSGNEGDITSSLSAVGIILLSVLVLLALANLIFSAGLMRKVNKKSVREVRDLVTGQKADRRAVASASAPAHQCNDCRNLHLLFPDVFPWHADCQLWRTAARHPARLDSCRAVVLHSVQLRVRAVSGKRAAAGFRISAEQRLPRALRNAEPGTQKAGLPGGGFPFAPTDSSAPPRFINGILAAITSTSAPRSCRF